MTVQAYKSTRKYETFSYLPPMTPEQVRRQIGYALSQGWNPAVEHTERENAMSNFLVHVEAASVRRAIG